MNIQKTDDKILNILKYSDNEFSKTFMKQYIDPIVWNNDLGYLPGSVLKFRQNKFGVIQLDEEQTDNDCDKQQKEYITKPTKKQESIEKFDYKTSVDIKTEQVVTQSNQMFNNNNPIKPETLLKQETEDNYEHRDFKVDDVVISDNESSSKRSNSTCNGSTVQQCNGRKRGRETVANTNSNDSDGNNTTKSIVNNRNGAANTTSSSSFNTSSYGRKRKRKVLDGEVMCYPTKLRRERYDKDGYTKISILKFDWPGYLNTLNSVPIPNSLFDIIGVSTNILDNFDNPKLPTETNFEIHQKLEGIDPQNESLFCVLTIVEVTGKRLRLHFDGYNEQYDFWVLMNSQLIFPIGWCQQNNRKLEPPKDYVGEFIWSEYLTKTKSIAAPAHCFSITRNPISPRNKFRPGFKLEAVDKRNQCMICVATIHDIIGDHVLVHFDSWNPSYDMWTHCMSPLLQPVGYCEENEKVLSVPSSYGHDLSSFNWDSYLSRTNSTPVTKECFQDRQQWWFDLEVGMRCEMIDKRCPQLIRVAHISKIDDEFQVTFSFDDWSEKYNIRIDLSCSWPQFLPVNWCKLTANQMPNIGISNAMISNGCGYSNSNGISAFNVCSNEELQPPPTYDASIESSNCSTYGCKGLGHVKGPKYSNHQRQSGCPYAECNLNKDIARTDRIPNSFHQNHLLSPSRTQIFLHLHNPPTDTPSIQPPSDLQLPVTATTTTTNNLSPLDNTLVPLQQLHIDIPTQSVQILPQHTASNNTSGNCEPMDLSMRTSHNNKLHNHQYYAINEDEPVNFSLQQSHNHSMDVPYNTITITTTSNNNDSNQDVLEIVNHQMYPSLSTKQRNCLNNNENANFADNNNDDDVNVNVKIKQENGHAVLSEKLIISGSPVQSPGEKSPNLKAPEDDEDDDPIFFHPPGDGIVTNTPSKAFTESSGIQSKPMYPSSLSLYEIQLNNTNKQPILSPTHKFYNQPRAPRDLLPNPTALVPSSVLRPNPALISVDDYSYCSFLLEKQVTLQILPQINQSLLSHHTTGSVTNNNSTDNSNVEVKVNVVKRKSSTRRQNTINNKPNSSTNNNVKNVTFKTEDKANKDIETSNNNNNNDDDDNGDNKFCNKNSVVEWNCRQVSDYVNNLIGTDIYQKAFIDNEVDGSAFLYLKQLDLMKIIGMKLGPAIKVATTIQYLRQTQLISSYSTDSTIFNVPTNSTQQNHFSNLYSPSKNLPICIDN